VCTNSAVCTNSTARARMELVKVVSSGVRGVECDTCKFLARKLIGLLANSSTVEVRLTSF